MSDWIRDCKTCGHRPVFTQRGYYNFYHCELCESNYYNLLAWNRAQTGEHEYVCISREAMRKARDAEVDVSIRKQPDQLRDSAVGIPTHEDDTLRQSQDAGTLAGVDSGQGAPPDDANGRGAGSGERSGAEHQGQRNDKALALAAAHVFTRVYGTYANLKAREHECLQAATQAMRVFVAEWHKLGTDAL